jgi:hypothetical protein
MSYRGLRASRLPPATILAPLRGADRSPMERKLDDLLFALMQNMTIAVSGEKLARD